jgi:hypothetical protein
VRPLVAALAAAAVLGAAITVPTMLHLRSGATAPATEPLPPGVPSTPPPDGVPLVWYQPPTLWNDLWVAADWSGRPVGSLRLPHNVGLGFRPSPDGTTALVETFDGDIWLWSASGRQLGVLQTPAQARGADRLDETTMVWASDGHTLCETAADGTLHVRDSAGADRVVGPEAPADAPAYLSWRAAACSVQADRAVLVAYPGARIVRLPAPTPQETTLPGGKHVVSVSGGSFAMSPKQVPPGGTSAMVRVVRLSTGAELWRRAYRAGDGSPGEVSADTRWVAESGRGNTVAVIDLSNGKVSGQLTGSIAGFLGGAGRALAIVSPSGDTSSYTIVDVSSGRTLWRENFPAGLVTTIETPATLPWVAFSSHFDGPWGCGSIHFTFVTVSGDTASTRAVDAC